jgi:hypothetical protein
MAAMHESMVRLYEAAAQIRNVVGQSALASLLSESPQTVNNWEARGISATGALKAQATLGCDATWLMTGRGAMLQSWPFPLVDRGRYASLSEAQRGFVQARMLQAIEEAEANARTKQVMRGLGVKSEPVSNEKVEQHYPLPPHLISKPVTKKSTSKKRAA